MLSTMRMYAVNTERKYAVDDERKYAVDDERKYAVGGGEKDLRRTRRSMLPTMGEI